jgi:hypothetical protein
MSRPLCLQCKRNRQIRYAEVTISDGRVTYWHHPLVCAYCLKLLSAMLDSVEVPNVTFGPPTSLKIREAV